MSAGRAKRKKSPEIRSEVAHFQSLSLSIIAASFPKAGAKVEGLWEPAKYLRRFFRSFFEVFPVWTDFQRITKATRREEENAEV